MEPQIGCVKSPTNIYILIQSESKELTEELGAREECQ